MYWLFSDMETWTLVYSHTVMQPVCCDPKKCQKTSGPPTTTNGWPSLPTPTSGWPGTPTLTNGWLAPTPTPTSWPGPPTPTSGWPGTPTPTSWWPGSPTPSSWQPGSSTTTTSGWPGLTTITSSKQPDSTSGRGSFLLVYKHVCVYSQSHPNFMYSLKSLKPHWVLSTSIISLLSIFISLKLAGLRLIR